MNLILLTKFLTLMKLSNENNSDLKSVAKFGLKIKANLVCF